LGRALQDAVELRKANPRLPRVPGNTGNPRADLSLLNEWCLNYLEKPKSVSLKTTSDKGLVDKKIVILEGNLTANVDGKSCHVTPEQVRILKILNEKQGALVQGPNLKKHINKGERPDKTLRRLPRELARYIESGRHGYRLTRKVLFKK